MTSPKSSNRKLVAGALAAAVAALAYGLGPGGWFKSGPAVELRGAPVRRGPMRISVLQRGNLTAKDASSIKSEIEGQTTVLYLIPEGTQVKPGDLLVELDSADLIEKRVGQEIAVQNAEAAFTKAKAAYEIQESQNKSDIELAERKLTFAQIDQRKYLEGDLEQLVKQADDKILLAEQKLTQADNTYNWSVKLKEKGFLTESELDRDHLDFQSAKVQLEQAQVAKKLLGEFDDPRKKQELDANLKEAERGLDRAGLRAQAMIADFEAAWKSSESRLKLEREKLNRYVDQIAKTRIKSAVSGMVVYTRGEGGRMGMGEPVQEGSQIRERQEILTIPRTGGMIVEASLHESVLKQVTVGMPCAIQVDALPGQEFQGKVQFVALLPDKGSWWMNPNTRLYRTEITISEVHPDMRPGMSCNIEIVALEIADTLYVPLQAVLLDAGQTIAFVADGDLVDQRKVKIGRSNDKWVEVLEGMAEGEQVLLSPPPTFQPTATQGPADDRSRAHAAVVPGIAGAGASDGAPAAGGGPGANVPAGAGRAEGVTGLGGEGAGAAGAGAGGERSGDGSGGANSGRRRRGEGGARPPGGGRGGGEASRSTEERAPSDGSGASSEKGNGAAGGGASVPGGGASAPGSDRTDAAGKSGTNAPAAGGANVPGSDGAHAPGTHGANAPGTGGANVPGSGLPAPSTEGTPPSGDAPKEAPGAGGSGPGHKSGARS